MTKKINLFFIATIVGCFFIPAFVLGQSTPPSGCASVDFSEGIISGTIDASGQLTSDELQGILCKPTPKITIPGLNFSDEDSFQDLITTDPDTGDTVILVPFLGQYLAAIYRYAVIVISILAVIIMIVSGIQWMMPSENKEESINKAKTRMVAAVTGLLLAVGSYTILYTIDPDLVEFKNLKVTFIEGEPIGANDGPDADYTPGGRSNPISTEPGIMPADLNRLDQCLYDNFLFGKAIGDRPDLVRIENIFGIEDLSIRKVNEHTAQAWRTALNQIQNSSDPEVRGFINWLVDFKNGNAPDLKGRTDGRGAISVRTGRVGFSNSGRRIDHFTWDMHSIGLAVDFMTRSNWDVHTSDYNGSRGRDVDDECGDILDKYEDNEDGVRDLIENPRYSLGRIPQKLRDCINENLPWSSIPDEFVRIMENNGFYWGGNGWGNRERSDAMHFEYYGPCMEYR